MGAPYLFSLYDGLQTMPSFIINQLVVDLGQTLQHLSKRGALAVSFWLQRSGQRAASRRGWGTDLVRLATGCGDADRVQLHGEEESDQQQEVVVVLLQAAERLVWKLSQQLVGLLQAALLASFRGTPVKSKHLEY